MFAHEKVLIKQIKCYSPAVGFLLYGNMLFLKNSKALISLKYIDILSITCLDAQYFNRALSSIGDFDCDGHNTTEILFQHQEDKKWKQAHRDTHSCTARAIDSAVEPVSLTLSRVTFGRSSSSLSLLICLGDRPLRSVCAARMGNKHRSLTHDTGSVNV